MVIRLLCKIIMRGFFSRVRVHHGHRFPASGPVVIISNHHSSLVDPVALIATMPRTPRFLAKSVLWSAPYIVLRPFLRLARAIPVYRHVDGGGDNTAMFAATSEALADGDVVAVFAEGASHNLPGLLELKTGAARIALAVDAAVAIVPVGIIYDDRARFRSRAMVYVGESVMVEGGHGRAEDRAVVRALTELLSDKLDEVAPSWESWEAHQSALMAARLAVADSPQLTVGETLTRLNRAVDRGSVEGQRVLSAMEALEAESARLGLDIETVVDRPRSRVARLNWRTALETSLFAIPTMLGRLVNMPAHGLVAWLARGRKLDFQATFKILAAFVVYPAWWVTVAALVATWTSPVLGSVVLVALPLLGYLAARLFGRIRRLRNRRLVRSVTRRDRGEWQLIALRHQVLDAVDEVLSG